MGNNSGHSAIIKEVLLDATPAQVWKAITSKEDMKQWYFDLKEFKPVPGFEFQFEGGPRTKYIFIYAGLLKRYP